MLADVTGLHAQGVVPGPRRHARDGDGVRRIRAREVLRKPRAQGIRRGVSGKAQAEFQEVEGLAVAGQGMLPLRWQRSSRKRTNRCKGRTYATLSDRAKFCSA